MKMKKIEIGTLLLAMLFVCMVFVPAVSAQEENNYSITAKKAFEYANAHMIAFIATDTPNFEEWKGASIDPKPLELYDINDQKLFYQFSVYKNSNLIGRIDVCADKTLGASVNDIQFNPKPFKEAEAMKKSAEIAKKNYPNEEIKSTNMVVYSYPNIGAMTVVKDKSAGVEHRTFVDAYTLDVVPDKPANGTVFGVWSMYEKILKNGKDNNLKDWHKSDQLTKSIEQAATNKGVNINMPVTEENIKKISAGAAIMSTTSGKSLYIPVIGQENSYYCGPASCQMIGNYYGLTPLPSQTGIYNYEGGDIPYGLSDSDVRHWCRYILSMWNTVISPTCYNIDAVTEIDNDRPFFSLVPGHYRVCRGYRYLSGLFYLNIDNPLPIGSGSYVWERSDSTSEFERIYVRP